jgi:probable phosphoglycerate mutase
VIYLLRHGQTQHNLEGRIQGRCDSPLTELGKAQARAMGTRLGEMLGRDQEFAIVSSPLSRAVASAEIVGGEAGLAAPLIADARLAEVGCGSWEKRSFASLCARDPAVGGEPSFLSAWALHCSDGESLDAAIGRLREWLAWVRGRKLVVVGHGVAGSLLRSLYLECERDELLRAHSSRQDRFHRLADGRIEEIVC